MDEAIEPVLDLLTELITVHGIFHAKLHFSSSRVTLWTMDDPYRFRLHGIADLRDPVLCLAYPRRDYPADAVVPVTDIRPILSCFRDLRFMDQTAIALFRENDLPIHLFDMRVRGNIMKAVRGERVGTIVARSRA